MRHSDSVDLDHLVRELPGLNPAEQDARLRALGDCDELLDSLAEQVARWLVIDLGRALETSELLIALADRCAGLATCARAREVRAQALAYANRFDEALAELDEARELALAADDPVRAAQTRLGMVHPLSRLGRVDDAIAAAEEARATFLAEREPRLAARAAINLGVVHRSRNEPGTALEHFDAAREAVASDPLLLAQLDSNRAVALLDLNRFAEAESAFRAALGSFDRAGMRRGMAIVEGNLADLMSRQGRLQPALYHFEQALRFMEADGAAGDRARLQAEQAEAFAAAGLLEEAAGAYAAALPQLLAASMKSEAARTRAGLGKVLAQLGDRAGAAACLDDAVRAFGELGHRVGRGRVLMTRARLAVDEGRRDEARTLLTEALRTLHDRPADAAVARHNLACLAFDDGDVDEAGTLIEAALGAARDLNLAPLLADLRHARARVRAWRGHRELALEDLRVAVAEIETVRGSLQADRIRAAFQGDRSGVYEDLVRALLDTGAPEDVAAAFHAVEQAKGRSLLDIVAGAIDGDAFDGETDEPLVAEVLRTRRELNALYSRFFDADAISHADIEACARKLQTLEGRLASARGVGGLFAPPIELDAAAGLLAEDTALVEYFVAGRELLAFVVRHDGVAVRRRLAALDDLEEQVERVHFEMARPVAYGGVVDDALVGDAREELAILHDMIFAPLADAIGDAARLRVVPHGVLHSIPFHALHDGDAYLVERFEIAYSPSASLLRELAVPERGPTGGLVVAVADELAPEIEREAVVVAEALGDARLRVGAAATAETLAREGRHAGVIHLACHARFLASSPLSSGLRLGDGWLTVRDLYRLRFDRGVVVLSGCDTGRVSVRGADELVGLVRGFFAAGASALVLSLWTVNDAAAREAMASVYRRWRAGDHAGTLAAALRRTQCRMLETHPHPAHWAPFVLLGRR